MKDVRREERLRESLREFVGYRKIAMGKKSIDTWQELGLVNDNYDTMFCGWNGRECTVVTRNHHRLIDCVLIDEIWTAERLKAVVSWREELLGHKSFKSNISRPTFWLPLVVRQGKLDVLVAFFEHIVFPFLVPDPTVKSFTLLTIPFPIGEHGSPWEKHQFDAVGRSTGALGLSESYLRRCLQAPKLAAWFVSCHSSIPNDDEPRTKTFIDESKWILHRKLRQLPIGVAHNAAHAGFLDAWNTPTRGHDTRQQSFRDRLLYLNFRNHASREKAADSVIKAFRGTISNDYPISTYNCTALQIATGCDAQRTYYSDILRSRFVLSPPGSKLDCHRHWEIIMLGAIPILLRSPPLIELFSGLPVLFVSDWSEVSPERLLEEATRLENSHYHFDWHPLTIAYWRHQLALAAGVYYTKFLPLGA